MERRAVPLPVVTSAYHINRVVYFSMFRRDQQHVFHGVTIKLRRSLTKSYLM